MTQPTQSTPDDQPGTRSLTSCPGPRRTIKQIADQLRRDLDAAIPFSEIPDGSYFSFLDNIGGIWRKTGLASFNAFNEQTQARCRVRPYDLVVPVTRYAEAAEAEDAPSGRAFLTVSGWKIPGVPS